MFNVPPPTFDRADGCHRHPRVGPVAVLNSDPVQAQSDALPGQPVAPALSVDRFTTFLQSLGRWRVVIIFTLFAFGLDAWFSYLESPGDRFWDKQFTGLFYPYSGGACLY